MVVVWMESTHTSKAKGYVCLVRGERMAVFPCGHMLRIYLINRPIKLRQIRGGYVN